MTGRVPYHLDLVLLRRDSDTNAWIQAVEPCGGEDPASGRAGNRIVRYAFTARFSCTRHGVLDRGPSRFDGVGRFGVSAPPSPCDDADALPGAASGLLPVAAFEDRLRGDVAREGAAGVALVRVAGLDLLEPLGDSGFALLLASCAIRVARAAGSQDATGIGVGEYLVRIPTGLQATAHLRAALRKSFAPPFASIGALPGVVLSVAPAVAPRDGLTAVDIAASAQGRLQECAAAPAMARLQWL